LSLEDHVFDVSMPRGGLRQIPVFVKRYVLRRRRVSICTGGMEYEDDEDDDGPQAEKQGQV